jgi:hypothetical protein
MTAEEERKKPRENILPEGHSDPTRRKKFWVETNSRARTEGVIRYQYFIRCRSGEARWTTGKKLRENTPSGGPF